MGLEVKKGEYARLKGWSSPSYVTKLIGRGLVKLTADGKRVDVEASDAAIAAAQVSDRESLRQYHARGRLAAAIDPQHSAREAAPENGARNEGSAPPPGGRAKVANDFDAYNRARADKESELAKLAKLDREEREGALVASDAVRNAAARVAAVITQGLEQLAPRLVGKLAAETDERKCATLLEDGVREIREELAREIMKIAGEEAAASG